MGSLGLNPMKIPGLHFVSRGLAIGSSHLQLHRCSSDDQVRTLVGMLCRTRAGRQNPVVNPRAGILRSYRGSGRRGSPRWPLQELNIDHLKRSRASVANPVRQWIALTRGRGNLTDLGWHLLALGLIRLLKRDHAVSEMNRGPIIRVRVKQSDLARRNDNMRHQYGVVLQHDMMMRFLFDRNGGRSLLRYRRTY